MYALFVMNAHTHSCARLCEIAPKTLQSITLARFGREVKVTIAAETIPPQNDIKKAIGPLVQRTKADFKKLKMNADLMLCENTASIITMLASPILIPCGKTEHTLLSINDKAHTSDSIAPIFAMYSAFFISNYPTIPSKFPISSFSDFITTVNFFGRHTILSFVVEINPVFSHTLSVQSLDLMLILPFLISNSTFSIPSMRNTSSFFKSTLASAFPSTLISAKFPFVPCVFKKTRHIIATAASTPKIIKSVFLTSIGGLDSFITIFKIRTFLFVKSMVK